MTAKAELIKVSKNFYSRGWMLGTSGNLSILIQEEPLEFLITASGNDKGELTEEDFLVVNQDGHCIEKETRSDEIVSGCRGVGVSGLEKKPSAETLLHSTLYKNTNAKTVYHVHTTNSTLLSMQNAEGKIEFSDLEMLKGLGFKTHDIKVQIPVIENSQDMKYLSEILPSYLNEEVPCFLLKGHGIYTWGKTPEETKRHVEILEFLFEYRIKELSLKI